MLIQKFQVVSVIKTDDDVIFNSEGFYDFEELANSHADSLRERLFCYSDEPFSVIVVSHQTIL